MTTPTFQEQLDAAGQALAEALRKVAQAPRGLKVYRQREAAAARQRLRALVRHPDALAQSAEVRVAPTCWCGAPLLAVAGGPVCSTGRHTD